VSDRGGDPPHDDDADGAPAEPHVLPLEDHIDLHAFRPRDVPDVVRDYLEQAVAAGLTEVRLIHGKGTGFQRERVRALLSAHPDVEAFGDAPAGRGHWGATLVRLRPGARPKPTAPPGPGGA
jgi:dsDNA-specific endonuclease/ATPase MutS2